MNDLAPAARAYVAFYESLTPETVANLGNVVTDDVRFKDPFNDVRGRGAYAAILSHMFKAVPDISFKVSHVAIDGEVCFLRWRSEGTLSGGPWIVDGMSELRFAPDGRVREHIDHWDAAAQFYERLPILGALIRFIRRRVAER
ncbi:MAG: nuclear transport factor 2 family protein [Rhodobacteraceae bacterium]|nr:nuclear transport factor 2 family protein [Paracoccaceae bacterium]